jgi:AraC-like DNA-binding protein
VGKAERTPPSSRSIIEREHRATGHLVMRGWRHDAAPTLSFEAVAHPGLELSRIDQGAAIYRIGGRTLEVPAGGTILVPPGVEHATALVGHSTARSFAISAEALEEVADAFAGRPGPPQPGLIQASAATTDRWVELLCQELDRPGPGQSPMVEALTEALLVELLRRPDAEPASAPPPADRRSVAEREVAAAAAGAQVDPQIRAVLDRIEACYAEPLTVADLARTAGMSRYHLSRRLREATGMSPYGLLLQTRVRRAAELLRGGHRSVTEVAFEVGFADLGRFAQFFRRQFGVSPRQFAAATSDRVRLAL